MSRIHKEPQYNTWYYIDNKGRKRGWYCNKHAAEIGLEIYLAEEELRDAEAARIPKESGGLLSGEQERLSSNGSRTGEDSSEHDCEKECGSTCNCSG